MAQTASSNHYERAFENWLIDNHVQYVTVDQHKRTVFARSKIKGFDFLLYPHTSDAEIVIAEVKGRKFKGASLAKLAGFQCWVTMDDVHSLIRWEQVFGKGYAAVFIFAYKIEGIDIELDGRVVYDFEQSRFLFFTLKLDDYRTSMTLRSPKWQTVTLPAKDFRAYARPIEQILLAQ